MHWHGCIPLHVSLELRASRSKICSHNYSQQLLDTCVAGCFSSDFAGGSSQWQILPEASKVILRWKLHSFPPPFILSVHSQPLWEIISDTKPSSLLTEPPLTSTPPPKEDCVTEHIYIDILKCRARFSLHASYAGVFAVPNDCIVSGKLSETHESLTRSNSRSYRNFWEWKLQSNRAGVGVKASAKTRSSGEGLLVSSDVLDMQLCQGGLR